ncbi:MAG: hypothetical protein ABI323_01520 [Solirubrobacteraceae bacterium]
MTTATHTTTTRSAAKRQRPRYVSVDHSKPTARAATVRAPHILWDPIPFGSIRKAQTVAYTRRHYGSFLRPTWHLVHPQVIVIHYTAASYSSTFNTFANVGYSDAQVLDNRRQMNSSLHLVHWLRCRFPIQIRNVIGHNESLSSPYHHEDVPSLRPPTHQDFMHRDMQIYRRRLRALGGC